MIEFEFLSLHCPCLAGRTRESEEEANLPHCLPPSLEAGRISRQRSAITEVPMIYLQYILKLVVFRTEYTCKDQMRNIIGMGAGSWRLKDEANEEDDI